MDGCGCGGCVNRLAARVGELAREPASDAAIEPAMEPAIEPWTELISDPLTELTSEPVIELPCDAAAGIIIGCRPEAD